MKRTVAGIAAVVAVVVGLFFARRAHAPAPRAAEATTATATATQSQSRAGAPPAATNSATAAAQPHAVTRIDAQTRTEMLRRIDTAIHHAAAPPSSKPAEPPELDQDYIQARIRDLLPLLSECYTNALHRDPKLAGKLVVDFSIVGDPNVGGLVGESKVNGDESTIADGEMRECVQETMYAAQLVPPKNGGEVHVRYPFVFSR